MKHNSSKLRETVHTFETAVERAKKEVDTIMKNVERDPSLCQTAKHQPNLEEGSISVKWVCYVIIMKVKNLNFPSVLKQINSIKLRCYHVPLEFSREKLENAEKVYLVLEKEGCKLNCLSSMTARISERQKDPLHF